MCIQVEVNEDIIKLFFSFLKRRFWSSLSAWFLHNFWWKVFLALYSINWPNLIFWLPLLLELLGNMLIVDICYPVCDSINFEINLSLFIKILSCMKKKAGQKFKYSENEKGFQYEIKSIFHHLNKLWFARNCPRI